MELDIKRYQNHVIWEVRTRPTREFGSSCIEMTTLSVYMQISNPRISQ